MAEKPWSKSVGEHGSKVTVRERKFGGNLHLQWSVNRKNRKKSLGFKLRTETGRIIQKRKKKAIRAAEAHRAKLLGESPEDEAEIDLTLQRAFELFFRIPDGYYAAETRDYKEVRRYADRIEQVLGPDTLWSDLVDGSPAKRLWRELARKYIDHGIGGHRSTERTVGVLFLLADWLVDEHNTPPLARRKRWVQTLKAEWGQITGTEPQVATPRFTKEEAARLDEHRPRLDPRARLLFDLAFGQRAGQHRRLRRSNINLEQTPDHPRGAIYVPGSRKKPAGWMHLTEAQFRHVKGALAVGYLSDFERRFQRGEIEDYVLFPGGRLVRGKGNPKYTTKPANRTWVGDRFRELEKLAGVKHKDGRGWHGVRRTAADLAEDVTDDARVLRKEGGWMNDETRRNYQQNDRPEILQRAAEVRAQIRGEQAAHSPVDGASSSESHKDLDVDALLELLRGRTAKGSDPTELLQAALVALSEEES